MYSTRMEITFTKMHGLGNDFAVINALQQSFNLTSEQIKQLGDRHFGIGFDQMLVIEPPGSNGVDISYRIFNNDGGEVAQCGNGARCVAAYLYERGIVCKEEITARTLEGRLKLYRQPDGQVRVNMGIPRLQPADIPFKAEQRAPVYSVLLDGKTITLSAVSMGNPHAIIEVSDVQSAPVTDMGPKLQQSVFFPDSVNVGFMQIMGPHRIRLRVYERGSGETLACGSGACAAVVAGRILNKLDQEVKVTLPGGDLLVSWAGEGEPVWMTGPAVFVYDGRITL